MLIERKISWQCYSLRRNLHKKLPKIIVKFIQNLTSTGDIIYISILVKKSRYIIILKINQQIFHKAEKLVIIYWLYTKEMQKQV